MPENKPPIIRDLVEVAELAASLPDHEDQLLQRGFEVLADALPSNLAAFLELEGPNLTLRSAVSDSDLALDRRHRSGIDRLPRLRAVVEVRECVVVGDPRLREEVREALGGPDAATLSGELLLVPVAAGEQSMGLLVFHNPGEAVYGPEILRIATLCGSLVALGILATRQADEVEQYRQVLEERNRLLVEEVAAETDACHALERCPSRIMRRLVRMAKQVAVADAPVLITGETGTGKEVVARAVHAWSRRADAPFVQLNCAALPENLVESELFGHRKGAFSGADRDRPGRFRVADEGTLLLDEIGELPAATQVKLLRVLQEGSFESVGSDDTVAVDVRVIAATNLDLERAVEEGRFREDLYYRLHVFPLKVPPLRERLDDLPVLVETLLERAARRTGGRWTLSPRALRKMQRYDWPGNVRELVNTLERARVVSPSGGVLDFDPPTRTSGRRRSRSKSFVTLEEHERDYIEQVLAATRGKIYGEDGAAATLGLPPSTLQSRMRRLGLAARQFRE